MKRYSQNLFLILAICFLLIIGIETRSWGAGYPERPITLIVPFPPGGSTDLGARATASFLEEILKQSVVVENKPGGMNLVGGNLVATAKPDGYILGYLPIIPTIPETFSYFQKPPYASKELTPICLLVELPGALIVKGDSPWKTVKEFVEYARKNPGVKVGTRGPGSIPSLMLIAISKAENVKFTDVPFAGDAPIATAVMGGHILAGVSSYSTVQPQLKAGNLRILLLYTRKRLETAPEIPCVTDVGYEPPVFPFHGIFGPRGLPEEIIQKISNSIRRITENSKFREKMRSLGLEIIYEDSESTKRTLKKYQAQLELYFKELGFWKE